MLSPYGFTGSATFSAQGKCFLYASSDAATSGADPAIEVRADGRSLGRFLPGDSVQLTEPASRWEVAQADASIALSGQVKIGDGQPRSGAISGIVEVRDLSVSRTVQRRQFFYGVGYTSALYTAVGVHAVARRCVVRRLAVRLGAAGGGLVRIIVGDAYPVAGRIVGAVNLRNKLVSQVGQVSDALVWWGGFGASPPDPATDLQWTYALASIAVNDGERLDVLTPQSTPFVLDAGSGIAVVAGTAGDKLTVVFETEEI